jgi:hypothetical protein
MQELRPRCLVTEIPLATSLLEGEGLHPPPPQPIIGGAMVPE